MLTREQNERITRTGPGTPGGELMRRYWHPVALSAELAQGSAPIPVRLFSEDLVLFRDEKGRVGLMARACPHRCTDLSFGRIEDGGLRCLYHGWLFDVSGKCLEMPAEPDNTPMLNEVRNLAYPCIEAGGLIFTYMGKGEPPQLPDYEFLRSDEAHRFLKRSVINCNYLQSLEGEYDPAHLSFLHRPLTKKDTRPVPGTDKGYSADMYYKEDRRPLLDYQVTDYGVRIFSVRKSAENTKYVRITNFIMPNFAAIVGNEGRVGEGYSVHFHVPIDDTHHLRFDYVYNRVQPVDKAKYEKRLSNDVGPDGITKRALDNRYFQDRGLMTTDNFTGMGDSFNVHDAFATESQGPTQDRSKENLGTTDVIIARVRKLLLEAVDEVESGRVPLHARRENPDMSHLIVMSEVVQASVDHKEVWKNKVGGKQAAE